MSFSFPWLALPDASYAWRACRTSANPPYFPRTRPPCWDSVGPPSTYSLGGEPYEVESDSRRRLRPGGLCCGHLDRRRRQVRGARRFLLVRHGDEDVLRQRLPALGVRVSLP